MEYRNFDPQHEGFSPGARRRSAVMRLFAFALFAVILASGFATVSASAASGTSAPVDDRAKRLRQAALEWDEIPGAIRYEIEIASLSRANSQPIFFKTEGTHWNGRLLPGKYTLKLRTYDSRNVPGEWGDASEFWVKIGAPVKTAPTANTKIQSKAEDKMQMTFSWQPVIGAEAYRFELLDPSGNVTRTERVTGSSLRLELPVARSYKWRVVGVMMENEDGEPDNTPWDLMILGRQLEPPIPIDLMTEFVRELSWVPAPLAESYTYAIERKDQASGKWRLVEKGQGVKEARLAFKEKYRGGLYRLRLQAVAMNRPSSQIVNREFKVRDGDRSPEAADLAMLKESLDKPTDYYFIASYFITTINYTGTVREKATAVKFDAIGGTGRLGLGYLFKESPWATFTIVDLSGFNIDGKNQTFASAETHFTWRKHWNVSLLRASGGIFYKELPEASGLGLAQKLETVSKVASIGPHLGFEFLHPFTYRLGLQANARIYLNATALSTPNGQPLTPGLSMQFSLLGSYRLRPDVVGFAGYSYRQDNATYKAKPGDSTQAGSSAARPGEENSISITGHYLNLVLEYAF